MSDRSSAEWADSTSDSTGPGTDTSSSAKAEATPRAIAPLERSTHRASTAEPCSENDSQECPSLTTFGLSENQRGELLLTEQAHQLTKGGQAGPGLPMRSDAPLIDLLVGGFPCQDVSVAGRRAGLAGERTSLFFDAMRVVQALRPEWVLLENVPGLLSSNGGRDFGVVLGTLADLGYGVAWRTLDSRFFGVPQRRRRLFILGAVADGDPRAAAERAGQVLAVGEGCRRHFEKSGEAGPDVASTLGASAGKGRGHDGNPFDRGGHSSLSGLGNGGPDDNDAQAGRLVVSDTVRSHPRAGSNSDGLITAIEVGKTT